MNGREDERDRAAVVAGLPAYEILRLRASGADGRVYEARERAGARRPVALKVSRWPVTSTERRHRFAGEVARAGSWTATGRVARLYASGLLPSGQPYLAMEFCPWSLADHLAAHGPLPPAEVVGLGIDVARTLAAVHRAGAVHGGVSPKSVLGRADGTRVLGVFGVATMVTAEQPVVKEGLISLAYLSLEQLYGRPPTPSTDVHALAATLYAALSGRPPRFPADRQPGIAEQVALYEQPVPELPGVPADLLAVLRRGLDNDPGRRQENGGEVARDLTGLNLST